jgi:hypothetical protein
MRPRVDGEQNEVAGILLKLDAASMVPIPSYELHLDDAVHALVHFFSVLSAGQARCILEKRILAHEYFDAGASKSMERFLRTFVFTDGIKE